MTMGKQRKRVIFPHGLLLSLCNKFCGWTELAVTCHKSPPQSWSPSASNEQIRYHDEVNYWCSHLIQVFNPEQMQMYHFIYHRVSLPRHLLWQQWYDMFGTLMNPVLTLITSVHKSWRPSQLCPTWTACSQPTKHSTSNLTFKINLRGLLATLFLESFKECFELVIWLICKGVSQLKS